MRRVAITGATGFLGRHLVRVFSEAGWRVRILARRDPTPVIGTRQGIEVTPGGLEDAVCLDRLCDGADLVVHAAGLVKARRDRDFHRANVEGADRLARSIQTMAPAAHTLLVSSLAAREPTLSPYAASKRGGEVAMEAHLGDRLTVVRPTAIYGPGDRETFALFAAAAAGNPLPILHPTARLTLVHVEDVARRLVELADAPRPGTLPVCDDRPMGYSWTELMTAAAAAVGREPRLFRAPDILIRAAAGVSVLSRLYGRSPVFTPGKANELLHRDWSLKPQELGTSGAGDCISINRGFADTVAWARGAGWL
jgi:nucleoside-diphosphate-sugar epimerase